MEKTTRDRILQTLMQTDWISGQELADQLNISRTAIWKQIVSLKEAGYQIESNKKTGYHLIDQGDRLTALAIEQHLQTKQLGQQIVHLEETETTQRIAHEQAQQEATEGTLIVCDFQTSGRGQLGRVWHETRGAGIAMSLILRPEAPLHQAGQLTLLAGIALSKVLRTLEVPVTIKWPNDLLIADRKVAGILTEMQTEADRINSVIIGIGINVRHENFPDVLTNRATSLKLATGKSFSRAKIVALFLNEFEQMYQRWLVDGFASFVSEWETYADRLNELVTLRTRQMTVTGYLRGIQSDGTLQIETEEGIKTFHSAELIYWTEM
ncbi:MULTISPECIES: biotin--[acetyl-CoA-carboxylase] ligase [Exiguobacterium]|uniref:biotin--[acetyl-CoA-carboxylase] ligase n=1 Tax=Exiguobacterium TaxID=33986 RepID=UPI00047CE3B3|nr:MULTISPECIES: biotin--[acetyl-CoA-carboxylase] ligase [Exiguobacterium]MCT4779320.1 biotin--[acetyl-CoA-carboxylase] ligase [Exiguobacterium soli]